MLSPATAGFHPLACVLRRSRASLRTFNKPLSPFLRPPLYHSAVDKRLRKSVADVIVGAMAVNRRHVIPDSLAKEVSPIQYVTENGFSIIRLLTLINR
jgi:hypothetical protein